MITWKRLEEWLYIDETKIMLEDWLEAWLETYVAPVVGREVVKGYKADCQNYIKKYLSDMRLLDVQPDHISQLCDCMVTEGCSLDTINRVIVLLNSGFRQAYKNEFVQENPVESADLPEEILASGCSVFGYQRQD